MTHGGDEDQALELARVLVGVAERLKVEFASAVHDVGLTPQQAGLLIWLREPTPMRVLADHLRCDASNVTGIVDRLEVKGYVGRKADPRDRRVKLVVLTPEGEEVAGRLRRGVGERDAVLAGLTTGQRRQLLDLLRPLVDD
ncbi:DNA-binding transcriptional regulator, MarR family [Streptoalloteichus tenebrarius]|uniref:DNA-binding transcriptional regulator, MarR family n=1 Tax=Streptoalloteichus tenebrarius (strain ATCC 17920 / DSM 40477 / JCM 4838 / CBS 697.72 / NBRC 16177 / NCIMB 11028 / NRRL B-12390 / A12253. 1 / ISP 5477) TaxID=1933 RepID=A0ABT1HV76_STRSD|nr:MarR family transcriptional regulator [Streptoalloteichus tenebrarius]MCP2259423.1 DNA-binding transcriptional regulator, MarR family [Streptoalloteichus tenebrarius]BFF02365.1 MarR family transcriptional regulator [Streptoalloteichus tenebrarius]